MGGSGQGTSSRAWNAVLGLVRNGSPRVTRLLAGEHQTWLCAGGDREGQYGVFWAVKACIA